ncbi:MAG: hypothetical protein LBO09_09175 [Candidatus Peribacteria bacterium]|nr:hypothetical protein [Candidatus Peribacteria bacterium]
MATTKNGYRIEIAKTAYNAMQAITREQGENMILWFGTVSREKNIFLIEEIFLPKKQKREFAQVTMDVKDYSKFYLSLPEATSENLHFMGSSRPRFIKTVAPSSPEIEQLKKFGEDEDYYLLGITNQGENFGFSLYFAGEIIGNIPWSIKE